MSRNAAPRPRLHKQTMYNFDGKYNIFKKEMYVFKRVVITVGYKRHGRWLCCTLVNKNARLSTYDKQFCFNYVLPYQTVLQGYNAMVTRSWHYWLPRYQSAVNVFGEPHN